MQRLKGMFTEELQKIIKENKNMKLTKEEIEELVNEAVKNIAIKQAETPLESTKAVTEDTDNVWAPSHYCVHHGGVNHNGKTEMAEAVNHNYDKDLGRVTHYDMKLEDGTILENVAFEDIQVTNASLAEGHGGHAMKRDDEKKKKDGK